MQADPPPPPTPALRSSVMHGMSWMMGQTLVGRVLGLVSQLALAYFLLPSEFGLVGLAYTVTAFFSFIESGGAGDVLVYRQKEWDRWAPPVFWFSVALGVVLATGMSVAAPFAALAYQEPAIVGLVWLVALGLLLDSLCVVPKARLRTQLAFNTIAKIEMAMLVLQAVLSVGLAAWGLGAYALVIPRPVLAAFRLAVMWSLTGTPLPRSIGWVLWPTIGGAVFHIVVADLATIVTLQGDYIALGWFTDAAEVGLYFIAFNLSTQTLRLLSGNLLNIMQPVFSSTQGQLDRQRSVYERCLRVMLGLGITMCFLQAAAAEPAIRLVFPVEYWPVAPLFAVLSLGMALRMSGGLSLGVLKGNGHFRLINVLNWLTAVLFAGMVVAAAAIAGEAYGVAVAVALWSLIYGPLLTGYAYVVLGGRWSQVFGLLLRPLVLAILAVGLPWLITQAMPSEFAWHQGFKLLVLTMGGVLLFILLHCRVDPEFGNDLRQLTAGLRARMSRGRLTPGN